jgi:ATP-binding cassette subfamily B protein
MKKNSVTLVSFLIRFMAHQKWTFITIFVFSLAWTLDTICWPYVIGLVIDAFTQFDTDRASIWPVLKMPLVYGALLFLVVELFTRGQGYLFARALPQMEAEIRMEMFDHVQRHSPSYFNRQFSGSLANKITDMTTHSSLIVVQFAWLFFPVITSCVLGILFFAYITPLFAALLGGLILIYTLICLYFTKKCEAYEQEHEEVRSSLLGKIVDNLTNSYVVNLFYRFDYEKARLTRFQKEEEEKNCAAKKYVEVMRTYLSIATLLGVFFINALMIQFWLKERISTGEVVQVFNMTWNIIGMLWFMGTSIPSFLQSVGIAKQAVTLMNDPQDIKDVPAALPLLVTRGEIVFKNVSFQYEERKIFQNLMLSIRGGEKVGLVGHSGAGKSTFVNLILRFYPLQAGQILIDGQDIAHVSLKSLRRHIALVPQDPFLFHRSLEENIRYGSLRASLEEVEQAAQLAHCKEFVQQLPEGYATTVGERGSKLSGGERQRVAIARAILSKAPILILDEATAALDSVTQQYIQDSLDQLMQGRTSLVIAHRTATLEKMDRILVFEGGKVVEKMNLKGGKYAPEKNAATISN